MIRNIIFDLAEVLYTGFYGAEHKLAPLVNMTPEEVEPKIHVKQFHSYMLGIIKEDEFLDALKEQNEWTIDNKVLKEVIREHMQPLPGSIDLVLDMKERGYKLGLLSDHGREWIHDLHEKYLYHRLFDGVQYSFEVGTTKKNPQAFFLLMNKMGAKPYETLFIDDQQRNLDVAEGCGLQTMLFTTAKEAKEQLADYLI